MLSAEDSRLQCQPLPPAAPGPRPPAAGGQVTAVSHLRLPPTPRRPHPISSGKYLNVVRECGHDVTCPVAKEVIYTLKERAYVEQIETAFNYASRVLLDFLMEEQELVAHLRYAPRPGGPPTPRSARPGPQHPHDLSACPHPPGAVVRAPAGGPLPTSAPSKMTPSHPHLCPSPPPRAGPSSATS